MRSNRCRVARIDDVQGGALRRACLSVERDAATRAGNHALGNHSDRSVSWYRTVVAICATRQLDAPHGGIERREQLIGYAYESEPVNALNRTTCQRWCTRPMPSSANSALRAEPGRPRQR